MSDGRLPRAKRWNEITFYSVENEGAIGVEVDRRSRVLTAAELGLTTSKSGKPVRAFVLLRRICEGNGVFDTKPWGGRENGKQVVSELRRGCRRRSARDFGEARLRVFAGDEVVEDGEVSGVGVDAGGGEGEGEAVERGVKRVRYS